MKHIRKELKIKTIGVFAVAALMLPLLLATSPASATTVADCTAEITNLKTNTQSVTYTNPTKDQSALIGKLENAIDKLTFDKFGDAIQKLTDYKNKVLSLISQGKIAPSADGVTPQELVNGADAAITCIQNIAT